MPGLPDIQLREIARISSKIGNYHLAPHGQSLVRLYRAKPVYSKEVDKFSVKQLIKPLLADTTENKIFYVSNVKIDREGKSSFWVFLTNYLKLFDSNSTHVRAFLVGGETDPRSPYYFDKETFGNSWQHISGENLLFINIYRENSCRTINDTDWEGIFSYFTVYSGLTKRFPEMSYFAKNYIATHLEKLETLAYMRQFGIVDKKKALKVNLASMQAGYLQYAWEESKSMEGNATPKGMSMEDFMKQCSPFGPGQIRKQS